MQTNLTKGSILGIAQQALNHFILGFHFINVCWTPCPKHIKHANDCCRRSLIPSANTTLKLEVSFYLVPLFRTNFLYHLTTQPRCQNMYYKLHCPIKASLAGCAAAKALKDLILARCEPEDVATLFREKRPNGLTSLGTQSLAFLHFLVYIDFQF